jgi:hypothetical protein
MTCTTPSRPVNIAEVFPELAPLARPGKPTPQDSSVGGPLLWPSDDPWPSCEGPHDPGFAPLTTLADVRLLRDMLTTAWNHPGQPGAILTSEERALVQDLQRGRHSWTGEPIAMLPVAQLYVRDIPDLHPPEGKDLLQVLWCPFDHPEEYMPRVELVWRSSSTATDLLTQPPQPIVVQSDDYVPEPCVVHPEQVVEYPALLELDEELRDRIEEWCEHTQVCVEKVWDGHKWVEREEPDSSYYQSELSVAPGWKVGGWAHWGLRDPWPIICTTCGTRMEPLLNIDSGDLYSNSWMSIEDRALVANPTPYPGPWNPVMIVIGRGYNMQIYRCPVSVDPPHTAWMQ